MRHSHNGTILYFLLFVYTERLDNLVFQSTRITMRLLRPGANCCITDLQGIDYCAKGISSVCSVESSKSEQPESYVSEKKMKRKGTTNLADLLTKVFA
jgi:hypothetical protein